MSGVSTRSASGEIDDWVWNVGKPGGGAEHAASTDRVQVIHLSSSSISILLQQAARAVMCPTRHPRAVGADPRRAAPPRRLPCSCNRSFPCLQLQSQHRLYILPGLSLSRRQKEKEEQSITTRATQEEEEEEDPSQPSQAIEQRFTRCACLARTQSSIDRRWRTGRRTWRRRTRRRRSRRASPPSPTGESVHAHVHVSPGCQPASYPAFSSSSDPIDRG